jgi:hypothetical protein
MTLRSITRAAALIHIAFVVGCAHADLSVDFVSRIALSPNGQFAALVVSGEGAAERVTLVRVASRAVVSSFATNDFATFLDSPTIEAVRWSADSAFLKIDITDSDLEHRVLVVQADSRDTLQEVTIDKRSAVAAQWATSGHTLYVVASGTESEHYPSGLFALDLGTGKWKSVITDRPVTAILDVAADRLLVKVPYDAVHKLPAAVLEILLPSLTRRTLVSTRE